MYKDKEKKKNTDALYRKQHWFAIKLKNQMYRRLPHVIERRKEESKRRKEYRQKYYQERKEYYKAKNREWQRNNPEKRKAIIQRYCEKLKLRRKRKHMRSKIERIIYEFLQYCQDRYDKETVRHYRINIGRFCDYIRQHTTQCKEYDSRYYQEIKKPKEEQDFSWTKEYIRIQYAEQLDRDFIARYVSFVNHDELNKISGLLLCQSEKESRLYPLKTFLHYCQRKGFIKEDLCRFIYVPPREKKILKRVLMVEEMERLLEAPNINTTIGIRDRALLELSYSGLRAEELLSLKMEDVDIATNTLTILNSKGNKDRVVPMTTEAIYWIKRWLTRRQEFITNKIDARYLFITKHAKTLTRRHLSKLIKRYAKMAGILLDISPHDLRRTTATNLAENGAPIRQIQALLGHASLKVTTKYLRLTDEKIKDEYKKTHPANRRDFHYADI